MYLLLEIFTTLIMQQHNLSCRTFCRLIGLRVFSITVWSVKMKTSRERLEQELRTGNTDSCCWSSSNILWFEEEKLELQLNISIGHTRERPAQSNAGEYYCTSQQLWQEWTTVNETSADPVNRKRFWNVVAGLWANVLPGSLIEHLFRVLCSLMMFSKC